MITVEIIPILKDNYAYLLTAPCGITAILDPGEVAPICKIIDTKNIKLDFILNTHHHWDHVDGNKELKKRYNAKIVAPQKEANQIWGVDQALKDGDVFKLGTEKAKIIETPGHTMGSICFYFKDSAALFTGDTLFSMGCGRLFEGTAQDMFQSFQKIMLLPDETQIYCGHEYTRGNAGFCLTHDHNNEALKNRITEVKNLRAQNKPTIPVSLALEKKTNIFMKAKNAEEFEKLRSQKDNFPSVRQ